MLKEESLKRKFTQLSDKIKRAIRQRAGRALTKDDLVRAVFDSFRSQQIELPQRLAGRHEGGPRRSGPRRQRPRPDGSIGS